MKHIIDLATAIASKKKDRRSFRLSAIGIRSDGAVVHAINGESIPCAREPQAHAEARLSRKLDANAIVFVIRVRANGDLALAKPCENCERLLRKKKVSKVFYSTNEGKIEKLEI